MSEPGTVTTTTPFLYARIWLHWLDTNEIRALSGRSLRLWMLLHAHAAGQDRTDAFRDALEQESGISDQHMRACFRELEAAGLLEREVGAGYGAAGRKSTVYKLLSPPSVREREERSRQALQAGREKRGPNQAPEQKKGGPNPIPVGGPNRIPSQDPSQDSSQDPAQEKHTEPALPGVSPSDFSEFSEEQPGTANRADMPAAGAPRPAGQPGAPRAQAENRPTSPEWPHGEPSHPLADFADTVLRDLDQAFEEYEQAEEDRDTRAQVERNGSTPVSQRAQGSSWTRAGAILPTDLHAGKPPGGTRPAGDIEDRRAQVETAPSTNTFKLSPRLQLKADARDLVVGWLQGRRMNRSPLPAELAYGIDLVTAYGLDGALEAVIAGNAALKDRNMLDGTMTFCGLKTVLADANKEAV